MVSVTVETVVVVVVVVVTEVVVHLCTGVPDYDTTESFSKERDPYVKSKVTHTGPLKGFTNLGKDEGGRYSSTKET